jgi:hypothetical protein
MDVGIMQHTRRFFMLLATFLTLFSCFFTLPNHFLPLFTTFYHFLPLSHNHFLPLFTTFYPQNTLFHSPATKLHIQPPKSTSTQLTHFFKAIINTSTARPITLIFLKILHPFIPTPIFPPKFPLNLFITHPNLQKYV